jgi:Protein of unknown function (DUF4236)
VGWRLRRSVKILPGIRLNFSRSGVSTGVGVRGAHVTVGHGKVRATVGLPGSGISYTNVETASHNALIATPAAEIPKGKAWRGWLWIGLVMALISFFIFSASCGSNDNAAVIPKTAEQPKQAESSSISREVTDIFIGLVADIRTRQSGSSVDTYAVGSHWRIMPDDMKVLVKAKTGYVGKINGQLVMLGSDGTNDIFSLSIRDHFDPNEVLSELEQVYQLRKLASDTPDGTRMDVYSVRDHSVSVGMVTLYYGVVSAIAGTGTVAFVTSDRAKKEMPEFDRYSESLYPIPT